jgi:hypothetical protein
MGTGLPQQALRVAHAPLIAPTGDGLDLVVGVEVGSEDRGERMPALDFQGKAYRIWSEVANFTEAAPDSRVYLVDRASGLVTFAPRLQRVDPQGVLADPPVTLAAVPAAGREIRAWYRWGGGEAGNVGAGMLTSLKDPIPGVQVGNPAPATGGGAAETLDNALLRGPEEIHSLRRAVTARDFETLACRGSAAVARARAFTKAQLWRHARPGTVEVLLVPKLGTFEQRGGGVVTADALRALHTEDVRTRIQAALQDCAPLSIEVLVNHVRYKTVTVNVSLVVHRGEDLDAVRARVADRLHLTINPLPTPLQRHGWRFGEPLRASHVYDIVLAEPGVSYVEQVRFTVDEVPDKDVRALAVDPTQPATWYAASGGILFRSLNDGDGWEPAGRFEGERVNSVAPSPQRPGLLAAATQLADGGAQVHVSRDCGEHWTPAATLAFTVHDMAWLLRGIVDVLLMATDKGLYELSLEEGATPAQIEVDAKNPSGGFYAVVAFADARGGLNVAVSAQEEGGVFLSRQGGRSGTFAMIGLKGEDIRVLALQRVGLRSFLWAGVTTAGNDVGKGCLRWELPAASDTVEAPEGWRGMGTGWSGGSCRALDFDDTTAFAATHFAGINRLDASKPESAWQPSPIPCGLPVRGADRLYAPVSALAVAPGGRLVFAGGAQGVFRSRDGAATFDASSSREFAEKVALPPTWLFCSGPHEVDVVTADEAHAD